MNLGNDASRLAAEARARVLIDRQLTDAGWSVQDSRSLNLFAAQGVAGREATMAAGHGHHGGKHRQASQLQVARAVPRRGR